MAASWLSAAGRVANRKLNAVEVRLRRARLLSYPVSLMLETTNRCNSWCMMCLHPRYRREHSVEFGDMSMDVFRLSKPFWRWATDVCLGGNGEPFLNGDHVAMARELKAAGAFVHTFSNGIALEPALSEDLVRLGYDLVHISLDGACAETYARIRGVDEFERVVENLRAMREAKMRHGASKPAMRFNITATRSSLRELAGTVRIASELGVDGVDVHHLDVYNPEVAPESPWLDVPEAAGWLDEAAEAGRRLGVEVNLPVFDEHEAFCTAPFRNLDVRWDGVVSTCTGYRFLVGDLTRESPSEVWNGTAMRSVRKRVWQEGYESVCPGCTVWSRRAANYLGAAERTRSEDLRNALG